MGGSGGGGGGGGAPSFSIPNVTGVTASQLVDDEITQGLGEARRVKELINALAGAAEGDLVVCALNAGQGDCCVMRLPTGEVVVVDCNARSANVNLVGFLEHAGIREIDLLVLTHPDHDHVSGLPALADAVKIRAVLDGRFRKEDGEGERAPGYETYREALDKLRQKGTQFLSRTPVHGDIVNAGGAELKFLSPHAPKQANDANEASLCLRLRAGNRTVLFGGDVTTGAWETILAKEGAALKSDVFWSSHHGAESGCLPDAVKAISPKLTIVSVGENAYGHPHDEPMAVYRKHSDDVRRTDDGSIGIISEGGKKWQKIT